MKLCVCDGVCVDICGGSVCMCVHVCVRGSQIYYLELIEDCRLSSTIEA